MLKGFKRRYTFLPFNCHIFPLIEKDRMDSRRISFSPNKKKYRKKVLTKFSKFKFLHQEDTLKNR